MNELFLLLANPAFDNYFRDEVTGGLKKELVFVVDNGPQEKPSSPLVQMCMARILKFLKLNKITQVSLAEYNSKRSSVEQVHAEENRVLSKHGPFSSHKVQRLDLFNVERTWNICLKKWLNVYKQPLLEINHYGASGESKQKISYFMMNQVCTHS